MPALIIGLALLIIGLLANAVLPGRINFPQPEIKSGFDEIKSDFEESWVSPTPTPLPTPVPKLTLVPIPNEQTENGTDSEWSLEKVDEGLTLAEIPTDPRMSTPDELFEAMNSYRSAHGLSTLTKDDTLCFIAQSRAEELHQLGKLDNHEGLSKYLDYFIQAGFTNQAGEVLFYGGPLYGVHIIEYGWDRSLTGHREVIQDPNYNHGCGGISGEAVVFIFGQR